VGRKFDIVSLPAIPRNSIDTNLDFGRISEMGLLQVLWADVERSEFGIR
jgi:hypothetical protein